MKKPMKLSLVICTSILLSACAGIGGYWMNGDPSVGRNILLPIDYWNNTEVTTKEKLQDWMTCGGRPDGNYTPSKRLPEETDDFAASRRMYYKIQRCMIKKSYHYLGQCDNEMAKASPGCGAP